MVQHRIGCKFVNVIVVCLLLGRERDNGVGVGDLERGGVGVEGGGSCAACAMISSWLNVQLSG